MPLQMAKTSREKAGRGWCREEPPTTKGSSTFPSRKVEVRRVCKGTEVASPLTAATSSDKPADHMLSQFTTQLNQNNPAELILNHEFKF